MNFLFNIFFPSRLCSYIDDYLGEDGESAKEKAKKLERFALR